MTIAVSSEKSARQSMSQQHQTGKRKVGIRLFKDLEGFCVKAPWSIDLNDRFVTFDLNGIPGSGCLIIFEQPNSNLMLVSIPAISSPRV